MTDSVGTSGPDSSGQNSALKDFPCCCAIQVRGSMRDQEERQMWPTKEEIARKYQPRGKELERQRKRAALLLIIIGQALEVRHGDSRYVTTSLSRCNYVGIFQSYLPRGIARKVDFHPVRLGTVEATK